MLSLVPFAGKILAESMLSLYPVFVKNIGVALPLQMWTRFVAYVGVAALFELLRLGMVGQQVGQVFASVIALGHMGKSSVRIALPWLDKQGDE